MKTRLVRGVIKIAIFIVIALFFSSCVSGYAQFYKPNPYLEAIKPTIKFLDKNENPKIIYSNNMANDVLEVLSNHYTIIGESAFNGKPEEEWLLKDFAKQIGATIVLYHVQYTNTEQGIKFVPQQQTTQVNLNTNSRSSSIYNGGVGNSYGSATTYGTLTTTTNQAVPYAVHRYDQNAVFFAPITTKFKLGIFVNSLTQEMRQILQRNNGVVVKIVYKSTPAFYANILSNDIIIGINDIEIGEHNFNSVLGAIPAGEKIKIVAIRNGQEKAFDVVLE
ncbi:MAG: PDZ domain-containing protein [Campylobacteraceae bacterium]|jgi:hypothetical protein|nr:PDZ domain-containing protein [Campylobacteraceae bacterium]